MTDDRSRQPWVLGFVVVPLVGAIGIHLYLVFFEGVRLGPAEYAAQLLIFGGAALVSMGLVSWARGGERASVALGNAVSGTGVILLTWYVLLQPPANLSMYYVALALSIGPLLLRLRLPAGRP